MCENSMRENREIPTTPSTDGGEGRSAKARSHTADMHGVGKSDESTVSAKPANKGTCDGPGGVGGEKTIGRGKGNLVRDIPNTESGEAGTLRALMSPGLMRLLEASAFIRQTPKVGAV